jgi:hypothetical protein
MVAMFRLKDHIISLVAVFLALGLGILIGSGMSDDMLVKQQRLLIEQMSKDFRTVREEKIAMEARVQLLTRDLYFWGKYQESLYPSLVEGVLAAKKTAILCHGESAPQGMLKMLHDAGVDVTALVIVDTHDDLSDGSAAVLVSLLTDSSQDAAQVELLESLVQAGAVHLDAVRGGRPDSVLLLVGDRRSTNRRVLQEVARLLAEEKVLTVAMEASATVDSLLGDFREMGLPTIDNADTVFGQISLLGVLQGASGHFGFKSGADSFVAPLKNF